MKSKHTRMCIVAAIAAGLLAGCNQGNTAKDDSTVKPATATSSAPYSPAQASKAPPQFGARVQGGTIIHYGSGN